MQCLSSRLLRPSSCSAIFTNTSKRSFTHHSLNQCLSKPQPEKQPSPAIPGQFLKWGSLGFVRTSRFASGFSPLEPKPLDSIMHIERAKHKSPEELASIWEIYASSVLCVCLLTLRLKPFLQCRCHTYFSLVLKITRQEEPRQLPTALSLFILILQRARVWCSSEAMLFSQASSPMKKQNVFERFNKETRDFEFKDVLRALNMPIL